MVTILKKAISDSSDTNLEALFNLKINKKMAIGTANFRHNNDKRSKNSTDYLLVVKLTDSISDTFNFENKKYVNYFAEGFTLKEYVCEYLQIRGNPYDRWYTMYDSTLIPSTNQLKKVNKIINNEEIKITDENCILFDFDFGS